MKNKTWCRSPKNHWLNCKTSSPLLYNGRILVSGALPLRQAVLITDASHQIFETCDPGPCFLSSAGHQIQGLHVLSVVETEAAVGVKAAFCIALEDLGLFTLTYFPDGVNGDCWSKQEVKTVRGANQVTKYLHYCTSHFGDSVTCWVFIFTVMLLYYTYITLQFRAKCITLLHNWHLEG